MNLDINGSSINDFISNYYLLPTTKGTLVLRLPRSLHFKACLLHNFMKSLQIQFIVT